MVRKRLQEGFVRLILYVCLPPQKEGRKEESDTMATPLVSVAQAGLMKPQGGLLSHLLVSVFRPKHRHTHSELYLHGLISTK